MRDAAPATVGVPTAANAARGAIGPNAARTGQKRVRARLVHGLRSYPTRTHGKVFFSAGAYDYQCSGTAVRAASRSLVFTAGHCAYGEILLGENAIHNWEFVPSYSHGHAPFGAWPAISLAAPAGWVISHPNLAGGEVVGGDSRYDVGAATVATRHGKSLQDRVGASPVAFNGARHRQYTAFGYPAEKPFNGRTEWRCSSSYRGSDPSYGKPAPIAISCNMTAGSSGGGWMVGGSLSSVTSYGIAGQPNVLYGPYFGDAIRSFYDSVSGG